MIAALAWMVVGFVVGIAALYVIGFLYLLKHGWGP